MEGFERDALHKGVNVQSYHTDNGIFKSKRFVQEVLQNARAICYRGVGAKCQNGVAEGAISIVSSRARTSMIHSASHWPEVEDPTLWPWLCNMRSISRTTLQTRALALPLLKSTPALSMIAKPFVMPIPGDVLCMFSKADLALQLEPRFLVGPLDLAEPNMLASPQCTLKLLV